MDNENNRVIVCLCGPSSVGKSVLIDALEMRANCRQACSITTRPIRNEFDRRISVSREEFDKKVAAGEMLETICYGEHMYGISRSIVDGILQDGHTAILDCNLDGIYQTLKADMNAKVITVFLVCEAHELFQRQMARQGNGITNQTRLYRLRSSLSEIEGAKNSVCQYVLHNGTGNFDATVDKLVRILEGDPSVESDPFDLEGFRMDMLEILANFEEEGGDVHAHR